MNATHNEVLVQCTRCGTRCAPWLAHCRKCGAQMAGQNTSPDWTDGQSNREMLESLDAMGGAGADLADQDVFKLLDEIEVLSKERARATELLDGDGQSEAPAEPRLGPAKAPAESKFFVNQLNELSDKASNFSDKAGNHLSDTPLSSPAASKADASATSVGNPGFNPFLKPSQEAAEPAQAAKPLAGLGSMPTERIPAMPVQMTPPPAPIEPRERADAPQMVESREIASPDRSFELGGKRKAAPEDFLPPDFFDPRDRKPKSRWGLWLTLAGVIVAMLLVAAFLIKKNYLDNRPRSPAGYGDLTKPAGK